MRVLVAIFLVLTSSLQAFEGFYVGGSTGPSLLEGRVRGTSLTVNNNGNSPADIGFDVADYSWEGVALAGYGLRCNRFYGAIEGFVKYNKHEYSDTRSNRFLLITEESINSLTEVTNKIECGDWHYG